MNNTGKILVALSAGVALGAVLGIMFAPDKGSETRRKIKDKGKKLADDVKDKLNKGREKFEDLKEGLKEKAHEFAKSDN